MPTFGSLFAGIGGIDLGLERAGWECRWQVEWDEFCQRVLAKHWPDVPRHGDITAVDFTRLERVDLIAGGFPCQPISNAGKRLAQNDDRWLWPEFARAIRDLRPRFVFVENVAALLGRGAGIVLGDLAALGYDAEWDCIPASAVGAPHPRDRFWLVAYACGSESERRRGLGELAGQTREGQGSDRQRQRVRDAALGSRSTLADASRERWTEGGSEPAREQGRPDPAISRYPLADAIGGRRSRNRSAGRVGAVGADAGAPRSGDRAGRDDWPAQSRVVRAPDGLPSWMDGHRWPAPPGPQFEWEPPRTVGRGLPNRAKRVKVLGNAVVPQIPEWIGRRLLEVMNP